MAGNLYVAAGPGIWKRDTQGKWSFLATAGDALGQVHAPTALTLHAAGNLYVADTGNNRVQKRAHGP